MTAAARVPILIVGGGIGGLAVALALANRGRRVHVLEKAAEFGEIGAGLQLAPPQNPYPPGTAPTMPPQDNVPAPGACVPQVSLPQNGDRTSQVLAAVGELSNAQRWVPLLISDVNAGGKLTHLEVESPV